MYNRTMRFKALRERLEQERMEFTDNLFKLWSNAMNYEESFNRQMGDPIKCIDRWFKPDADK